MIFKYKKYEYSQKKETNESKLSKLSTEYEVIFLKLLNKEDLSIEEGQDFLTGFEKIKKYLVNSLLYQIKQEYEKKTPIEKKLVTLYNQYMYMYPDFQDFNFRIIEELNTICENSIYSSIGYGKKPFNKENEESNLILYINNVFFFNVLNFLDRNVNALKRAKSEAMDETYDIEKEENNNLKEIEIDTLLKDKNIRESVGDKMFNEIKEVLIDEKDIPAYLVEIIKYIKS